MLNNFLLMGGGIAVGIGCSYLYQRYITKKHQPIFNLKQASLKALQDENDKQIRFRAALDYEINGVQRSLAEEKSKLLAFKNINKAIYEKQNAQVVVPPILPCTPEQQEDLKEFKRIGKIISNKRSLSKLIWSDYFQKNMTALCNRTFGDRTVCGIYKITNLLNHKVYIGQSVDTARRWKDHAKCGLGIDTPANNSLYQDMQEQGIWNFSWELLQECPKEQLDFYERTYIDAYDSYFNGYNSTKGNKDKPNEN